MKMPIEEENEKKNHFKRSVYNICNALEKGSANVVDHRQMKGTHQ